MSVELAFLSSLVSLRATKCASKLHTIDAIFRHEDQKLLFIFPPQKKNIHRTPCSSCRLFPPKFTHFFSNFAFLFLFQKPSRMYTEVFSCDLGVTPCLYASASSPYDDLRPWRVGCLSGAVSGAQCHGVLLGGSVGNSGAPTLASQDWDGGAPPTGVFTMAGYVVCTSTTSESATPEPARFQPPAKRRRIA